MEVASWITVTILVNFIALVFQIGAYVAPMWGWYQSNDFYVGLGLWYIVGCPACSNNLELTSTTFDLPSFVALRVLQSVGTAGVLTLVVFLIVYKMGYTGKWSNTSSMNTVNLVAFVLCIFTILVLLASAVVFCVYFWTFFLFVNSVDKTSLPWSPMMSLLATLILILVCIFIRTKCRVETFTGHIPMSGDAKFDLHPHVQNGYNHRYYNQTPYIEDRDRGYSVNVVNVTGGGAVIDDHKVSRVKGYDDYDDRRNNAPTSYEQRTTYVNRAYTTEPEQPPVYYTKSASREFRENRDREMGHTIYTGNGFSYLKGEVNRPDRDEVRYGRPVALAEYSSSRHQNDDYYDHLRASGRTREIISTRTHQSSPVYIYRPHQYQ